MRIKTEQKNLMTQNHLFKYETIKIGSNYPYTHHADN